MGGRIGVQRRGTGTAGAVFLAALLGASPLIVVGPAQASPNQLGQARKALLVLSDMPAGWVKAKSTNRASNVGNAQLAHCIGVASSLITENPPSVSSSQFQDRQGTLSVNDNVTVFPSTKNASAELAIASNPKTPGCMTTLAAGPLKDRLFGKVPKGETIGNPLVSPVASSAFGAGTAGYSLSVPITTHGVTLNVTVTQLFAVAGRLGQQVTFTSVGTPFSIGLEQHITTVAVGRL